MKRFIKIFLVALILIVAGGVYLYETNKVTFSQDENQPTVRVEKIDQYEERVEKLMKSEMGQEYLRVWAEQKVSNEIITERETRLEELREKEMSF